MSSNSSSPEAQTARERLDAHVREIVRWHFSEETGSPFWLEWKRKAGWDPAEVVQGYDDLRRFPHFQDEWLRDEQNERWAPKAYQGRPFYVFETGGTTGMPKQRIGWEDHFRDYGAASGSASSTWPTSAADRATTWTWTRAG
jgi:phenylacetate-coenzyme A ligase PaaK-like adenylate-forming protein